ncbi:head-tail connector protein [Stappia indica]|uniref:head-tail connector protein n=1 Tax=Stappia indica TaxID=538381 RepID=UPI00082A31C5|nr:head-tail connector protein [Stappia indica]
MTAIVTTPPAVEPVTLEEARAQLRVTTSEEDALLGRLIAAARGQIELATRRALITQGWRLYLDAWPPGRVVRLPVAPVASVEAVAVYDGDGLPVALDPGDYRLEAATSPPRLKVAAGAPAGLKGFNGIEIDFTAGYGAETDAVPGPLRQAVLLLVAHWFEHREPGLDPAALGLPPAVASLAGSYRILRL